jgi:hypothetical protein
MSGTLVYVRLFLRSFESFQTNRLPFIAQIPSSVSAMHALYKPSPAEGPHKSKGSTPKVNRVISFRQRIERGE